MLEAPDEVLTQLRAIIAPSRMPTGGRLPSERRLAEQLKATRFAVRGALQQLEKEGLIRAASKRIRVVSEQSSNTAGVLSNTVALVSLIQPSQWNSNPTSATSMQWFYLGAAEALQAANMNLLTLHPQHLSPKQMKRFASERLVGCAMLSDALNEKSGLELTQVLLDQGVPVAAYGDALRPAQLGAVRFDRVNSDHRKGSYEITKYLISRGCKKIQRTDEGEPESMNHWWRTQRALGYEQACQEGGITPLPVIWIPQLRGYDGSAASFSTWARLNAGFLYEPVIKQKCDALLAISDGQIPGLAGGCRHLGKDPEREIVIAGYDNYWPVMHQLTHEPTRPVATVDKCQKEIGRELIELLLARAARKLPTEPQVRMITPKLLVTPVS